MEQNLAERIHKYLQDHESRVITTQAHELLREASVEITKLSAELGDMPKSGWYQEVKRLRDALHKIDGEILLDKYEYRRIAAEALANPWEQPDSASE